MQGYKIITAIILVYSICFSCIKKKNIQNEDNYASLKQAIDPMNDYRIFEPDIGTGLYETSFFQLPFSGTTSVLPWSDTYWPTNKGGIQYRWQTDCKDDDCFKYKLYKSMDAIKEASIEEIAKLSPAEKLSIYSQDYNFDLVLYEREKRIPKGWKAASWEGICHGWAPASLNFTEPAPVTLVNPDGITVPFGAADIKALLAYNEGVVSVRPKVLTISPRCNIDFSKLSGESLARAARSRDCRGVNAGSFHLVLANHIGKQHKGFVADITSDAQVWNQPIHTFKSYILRFNGPSPTSAPGTVKEVEMITKVSYTQEILPKWDNGVRADKTKYYRYKLELDENDKIIGGEYLMNNAKAEPWPDFIWNSSPGSFERLLAVGNGKNYVLRFDKLKEIYEASIKQ